MATDSPTFESTAEALGNALGISKEAAYTLIQFGKKLTWITELGHLPSNGARGRGPLLYRIPVDFPARLTTLWSLPKEMK